MLGNRGRVYGDERPFAAAVPVHGVGHDLLAHARFPEQEHGGVRGGDDFGAFKPACTQLQPFLRAILRRHGSPHFSAHVAGFKQAGHSGSGAEARRGSDPLGRNGASGWSARNCPHRAATGSRREAGKAGRGDPASSAGPRKGLPHGCVPGSDRRLLLEPSGDFRAGEVTGAAAEQGFTVHTERAVRSARKASTTPAGTSW